LKVSYGKETVSFTAEQVAAMILTKMKEIASSHVDVDAAEFVVSVSTV
jgi:molecular chaperone DnaK (HSP70)